MLQASNYEQPWKNSKIGIKNKFYFNKNNYIEYKKVVRYLDFI